ncbi:S26 family signal peptidase [Halalkalirubrum salinum]|uniref:S26 family signal peptidase n=1 Tax=Halalkalirubrum salinum TaxID=2563889 RepID=UPI0010FB87D3|nr:S26 family signal peptidase [Halalkalirubrum salinum]
MGMKRYATLGIEVFVIILIVGLLAGQFLGQPIFLSFVETGSMSPTLEPGDGFIAIPAPLVGGYEPGDVVTFDAEEIEGGGLTTHRIAEETDRGYTTRGDANPFTDQDSGEPPVQDAEILAKAATIGGSVIVIPHLGTAVMGLQGVLSELQLQLSALFGTRAFTGTTGIAYILFGLSTIAYLYEVIREKDKPRERSRDRSRDDGTDTRLILAVLALVLMGSATAAMVMPGGTEEFDIVSSEFSSENPTVIQQNTTEELPYSVPNGGLIPTHVYYESRTEGIEAQPDQLYLPSRSNETVNISITTPPETGYYQFYITEHRYLAVLPASVIDGLQTVHPWAPIAAINAVLGGGIYLLGTVLIGTGRIRTRHRDRPSGSLVSRLFK